MKLDLQTRDAKTNKVTVKPFEIDPKRVGVVLVDPWNWHWCMTATQRFVAMGPRLNKALAGARKLGMQVFLCPTDVAGQYCGWPQRERAMAVEHLEVPAVRELDMKIDVHVGPCMCGPGLTCVGNYGWDGMNPDLHIAEQDLVASGSAEIYSLIREHNLDLLIYMGGHTNMCLLGKPPALKNMWNAGIDCCVARDLNDAFTYYGPDEGFTPDDGTARVVEEIEESNVPTINMADELSKENLWDNTPVEMVRITPWGTEQRPHLFEKAVTVTLRIPLLADVEIRYTLDGSGPDANSTLYAGPLKVDGTTNLTAAAFKGGQQVSLPSNGRFDKLPAVPPKPDVYLDEVRAITEPYGTGHYGPSIWFWHPQKNESFEKRVLQIRKKTYARGLGMRAPAYARYELKPEYDRFVALVGNDDHLSDDKDGRFVAMYSSVVYRVTIDGVLAAESPVMRISFEPWRFDVKIPEGARQINLVTMDAGSRSAYDLGNWVDAGFVLKK